MNAFFAVALFALIAQTAAQSDFSVNTTGLACKRSVHYTSRPRILAYTSEAACKFGNKGAKVVEAAAIYSQINVIDRPDLSIAVFHATAANMTDVSAALAGFRVILERVIEYQDVDGVPGYQPQIGGDSPCPNGITLLLNAGWTNWAVTSTAVGGDPTAMLYTATSTSTTPSSFTLSVSVSSVSLSNGKIRLDPSSFKFEFDVNDYVYNNAACASGLAFKIIVVSGGTPQRKSSSVIVNTDVDLSNQDTYAVPDVNDNDRGAYFAWDRNVTLFNGTGLPLHHNVSVLASDVDDILDTLDIPIHWTATAMWYSVVGQVTSFSWDPYAMVDDSIADTSSATTVAVCGRVFVVIMVVFAALL
jgi:hypothetical protein